MKCPECQTENPETRKFCRECGAKLILFCPLCSSENLPGDKFCGECGQNLILPAEPALREASFYEKIAKIQKYLPKGLTDKILSQRDRIEGERKQVTVMFCDMEGYSQLSERLGPEEAYNIMDQVYEVLIHKVHDYEGTVNEMTGDGIMALFGAPIALEDAPQRAIRSAMAVHREMVRFSNRMKEEGVGIPPLKMRVGIHTGPVVVGTLGNDLRVEFKAVGETVNLASRMEGLAEPGASYVTEDTFKLTEGFFRFEALGEKEVKGKKEPIKVYRVIAPSTRRTRFDVSAERGLTPFVGREREVDLLLDAFERTKAARGQAISIMSEAGVGKSRLLYEFRKAVSNEDITFLEGHCLSYSRGVAYHPVIDILKSNFDVLEGDGDAEIREKVKTGLKTLGLDEASNLPYFLELLSVKDSGIDKIMISPEGKKDRIIEALKRIVLKGSEIRPLIMAFEDLHWGDKSSEDVLKYLLESIPGARVLLIFTYRPEFVHTWGAKSFHNQLTLNRLSNQESLAMVSNILGSGDIGVDLQELILEKTEGVPFYIEEFIKSLSELKMIERSNSRYYLAKDIQDVTIPSTIQEVIMARVDSLPEDAKELLQTGSVIEREFDYSLIKHVTGLNEQELLSNLSILKESELLYERGIYPQSNYIFKHALTREVVYDSILTSKKKMLHDGIGKAIEKLYKENIDEHYSVLAEHYFASENYEKGAEYSRLAAKKARKAGSLNDALQHTEKRILSLERSPKTEATQRKMIDARTALSGYYMNFGRVFDAKEAVAPVVDLASELDYQRRLPGIYTAIGLYNLYIEEDFSKAYQYLNEAIKISEQEGDFVFSWFATYFLAGHTGWNCEFEMSLKHTEKCCNLSELANNPLGISTAKSAACVNNYTLQGKLNLAFQVSEEALQIAEQIDDIMAKGLAYTSYGTAYYFKGSYDEARNRLSEGLPLCEKIFQVPWTSIAYSTLGHLYFDAAEYERAKIYYNKAGKALEDAMILPSFIRFHKVCAARARVLNNDRGVDLDQLYSYYERNKYKSLEGFVARLIGEILLNIDDQHFSEAEDWIQKAIEADSKNGTIWYLGRDYAVCAELFKRKENQSKAKENLSRAIEIFKDCGADGWVKKYEEELASFA